MWGIENIQHAEEGESKTMVWIVKDQKLQAHYALNPKIIKPEKIVEENVFI